MDRRLVIGSICLCPLLFLLILAILSEPIIGYILAALVLVSVSLFGAVNILEYLLDKEEGK